jgi:hypothetical protein
MDVVYLVAAIFAFVVFAYLLVALFIPEKF